MIVYAHPAPAALPCGQCPDQIRKMRPQPGRLGAVGLTLADLDSSLPAWDITYLIAGLVGVYLVYHFMSKSNARGRQRKAFNKIKARMLADENNYKATH